MLWAAYLALQRSCALAKVLGEITAGRELLPRLLLGATKPLVGSLPPRVKVLPFYIPDQGLGG